MNRFLAVLMLVCLFTLQAGGQDSITPNNTKNQLNVTLATAPNKILSYAKYIGYGEPSAASVESVDSALTRLFALIAALPQSSGGVGSVTMEFSADNVSWHATQNVGTDGYLRISVDGTVIGVFAFHPATTISLAVEFQYSADGLAWHSTEVVGTDTHWRFRVGDGAWTPALPIPSEVSAEDVVGLGAYIQGIVRAYQVPVGNIDGFDARVEHLIALEGISESQVPLWSKPVRQVLRVGTPFSIAMADYVDSSLAYSASELPAGMGIDDAGVISGTPTTEGESFPIVTATNAFGSATISFPMLVLRQESFDTLAGHDRLKGLTVNGSGRIVAIDESGTGNLRLYPHKGNPSSLNGLIPVAEATAVTLAPESGVTAGYAGIVFDGTNYVTLADPTAGVYSFIVFNASGAQQGNTFANSRLTGARSLAYNGATSKYWAVEIAGGQTYASAFAYNSGSPPAISQAGQPQHRLSTSQLDIQGLVIKDSRFFAVDNASNQVQVFTLTGSQGSEETYRQFSLVTANNRPRGITYHEGYFYVLNQGAGNINDTVFMYPDRGTWDASVPDLELLEFVTRGPFKENNVVRVRATFSAPVDISADVKLRLNIGGQEREAISVASAAAAVTAVAQDNTRTGYFAYTVQDADTDTDADGIETYQFPFQGGSGDGSIYPHTGRTQIDSHNLIGNNSRFRVTQPGSLRTLLPRSHTRVNTSHQADWTETDPDSLDFILNKPKFFPIAVVDQVSLNQFAWVKQTKTGVEYLAETAPPTSSGILNTIEQDNGWAEEISVPHTDYLYMRVAEEDVGGLSNLYVQSNTVGKSWYTGPLSRAQTDSAAWVALNSGSVYQGHFYYGLKVATSVTANVHTARRQLPYSVLYGVPDATTQVQSDWTETDTKSPAFIEHKPVLALTARGDETNSVSLLIGESHTMRVNIPESIRTYASRYSIPIDVRIDTNWHRDGTAPATTSMKINVLDAEGRDFTPPLMKVFNNIPTTDTHAEYEFQVPAASTDIQVEFERNDDGAGNAVVGERDWQLSFTSTHSTLREVTASTPLSATGTTSRNISVANNAIAPQYLTADTDTEKAAMRERIDAAWAAGNETRIVIAQQTQGAGGAGANLDYQTTFTPAFVNYADGRPYEVSLELKIAGSATTSDVVITASIMDTGLTTTYDTEDITSSAGTEVTEYLSASLPAGATGFILRTVRKTGTLGYRREAEGAVQVVPKSEQGETLTWNVHKISSSPSGITPTFYTTTAHKIGNLLFLCGQITYHNSSVPFTNHSMVVNLPTGITYTVSGQAVVIDHERNTGIGLMSLSGPQNSPTLTFSVKYSTSSASTGTILFTGVFYVD